MNLGFTNFADGGPPSGVPPGFYLVEYGSWYSGTTFRDSKGDELPGRNRVDVLVQLNQFVLFSLLGESLTGGLLGLDFLIPLVAINLKTTLGPPGGLRSNRGGVGDLFFGPLVQWNKHTLFGMPYLHRFELDFSAPAGDFDKRSGANPGSNLWTIRPYYAQTLWLLPLDLEISLRHNWLYSTEHHDTHIKPGTAYHVNYAASYGLTERWRMGLNGYALQQLTSDELKGREIRDSKERAFAMGPGLVYSSPAITFLVNSFAEFGVENRPQGYRLQAWFIYKF